MRIIGQWSNRCEQDSEYIKSGFPVSQGKLEDQLKIKKILSEWEWKCYAVGGWFRRNWKRDVNRAISQLFLNSHMKDLS